MPKHYCRPLALSQTAALALLLLGVPQVVLDLADYVSEASPQCERDLWCADLFSGKGSVSRVWSSHGFKTSRFDINDDPAFDLLTPLGFALALRLVLRLRPGALAVMGPPCGSFVFINLSTSKRNELSPYGDTSLPHVCAGNMLMARACILAMVATVRGAFFLLEQPFSSCARFFPALRKIMSDIDRYIIPCHNRTFFWMGTWGHFSCKPSAAWGTMPNMNKLFKTLTQRLRKKLTSKGMVKRSVNKKSGKVVVSGGPKMKDSAAYPKGFAERLLHIHRPFMVQQPEFLKRFLHEGVCRMRKDKVQVGTDGAWIAADLPAVRSFLKTMEAGGYFHKIR